MADYKYICTLFLGLAVGACQSPQLVEDRLVAAFGETMFGGPEPAGDHAVSNNEENRLSKWPQTIRVSVVEGATEDNVSRVEDALQRFADVTALDIDLTSTENGAAQLKIFFSGKKDFLINNNEVAACYTSTQIDSAYRLESAEIHISKMDKQGWRDDCFIHELLHAFGWRGHTHRIRSAISYMHGESELTRWDVYLMRTLYDPRLEPGTRKSEAVPKARTIIRELLQER